VRRPTNRLPGARRIARTCERAAHLLVCVSLGAFAVLTTVSGVLNPGGEIAYVPSLEVALAGALGVVASFALASQALEGARVA
jgi:hypothetical protein